MSSEFQFPGRALHKGHPPAWSWIFLWWLWIPIYAVWFVALAAIFVVCIPVNVIRAFSGGGKPKPRYDTRTGERLR